MEPLICMDLKDSLLGQFLIVQLKLAPIKLHFLRKLIGKLENKLPLRPQVIPVEKEKKDSSQTLIDLTRASLY